MIGLALAALATGVVYIIITMRGEENRRKRRNYELKYEDNLFVDGMYLEQIKYFYR